MRTKRRRDEGETIEVRIPSLVIPQYVATAARLSLTAKLIFGLIYINADPVGFCRATHRMLAKRLRIGERTAYRAVKELRRRRFLAPRDRNRMLRLGSRARVGR